MATIPEPIIVAVTLSTKSQWNQLHQNLNVRPLHETRSLHPSNINTIDRRLLLAALVKKSAERDLLEAEAEHAHQASRCGIEFPNYDVAVGHQISTTSPPPTPASAGREPHQQQRFSGGTPRFVLAADYRRDDEDSSPVSPTFGPRQGSYFSGTVARRRSVGYGYPPLGTPTTNGTRTASSSRESEDKRMKKLIRKDWEKRVQWEAAWLHIERHLDLYAEKFKMYDDDPNGRKTAIWEELVSLREQCEALEERIREEKEDVRR